MGTKKENTGKKETPKMVKIQITKSMFGKFKMPYDKGNIVELEEKFAAEVIDAGYATSMKDVEIVEETQGSEKE